MKKFLLAAALLAVSPALSAQSNETFETVPGEKPGEVIYRGPCTFSDLEKVPAFDLVNKAAAYQPDPRKIKALAAALPGYQLVVFLGTWCEDSHRLIPQLYRVLQDAGYPPESVQLYALDRAKAGRDGEEKEFNISLVPTIILLEDGSEAGRITETVQKNIETDLLGLMEDKGEE